MTVLTDFRRIFHQIFLMNYAEMCEGFSNKDCIELFICLAVNLLIYGNGLVMSLCLSLI